MRWLRAFRIAAIAVLLPIVAAIQLALVLVYAFPFDRDRLIAGARPLELLDVHGETIATLPAAGADLSHWIALDELPAIAVSAVIESEDKDFWSHHGIDGAGIARAMWLDARGGRFGGSTLTMQLARMVLGTENARTIPNKLRETVLALRIERALDKREILEQWLNRAYFGNGTYGMDAAARLYFGKPASALSAGEATLLAVIPRAPTAYDPLVHFGATLERRDRVLDLLADRGVIAAADVAEASAEVVAPTKHVAADASPQLVHWLVDQLPREVRAQGGTVHTTIDLRLQRVLERRVADEVRSLRASNLGQAGMVVLAAQTSDVLAMVGSAPGSQLNITTRRRNPGSALKPFVYATAIEQGGSPSSIAWDVRDTSANYFESDPQTPEHGPVRYRVALASSFNFAAIDVLDHVGIARVMSVLRAAGVAELPGTPNDYGLRLALGAAKVRLLDLAAGYGFLVKGGVVGTPHGIAFAVAPDGSRWTPPHEPDRRVFTEQTAWLTMDMLSDPEARRAGFGMELPFDLPFRIAAKTGTARGFADTWAIGATREVIVGAWAGTFDGTPTHGLVGMDAAAPLVRDGMLAVAATLGRPLTLPTRPAGIDDVHVCADSGMPAGSTGPCAEVHDYAIHGRTLEDSGIRRDPDGRVRYPDKARGWLARRHSLLAAAE
ncbi:MAG TPA: transglycosylase domain-containing protein [Kofleriaceae bacterium]|jgi:penicillin-binding protein 1C